MISAGISGRPLGSVRLNPRAPYADKVVGAFLFSQASGGLIPDLAGRTPIGQGNALSVPSPFGMGIVSVDNVGFASALPPPTVASFAVGGILPAAGLTGLVIGAGDNVWNMAVFNWSAFVSSGAWRFGVGLSGSVGAGTTAPAGRFDVGMSRDFDSGLATCYVSGQPVLTNGFAGGTDASKVIRGQVVNQGPSTAILDYLLLFSATLPASVHADIRRNPYQYFRTAGRSLWSIQGAPADAPPWMIDGDFPSYGYVEA